MDLFAHAVGGQEILQLVESRRYGLFDGAVSDLQRSSVISGGISRDGTFGWTIHAPGSNFSSVAADFDGVSLGSKIFLHVLGSSKSKKAVLEFKDREGKDMAILCAVDAKIRDLKVLIVSVCHPERASPGELRIVNASDRHLFGVTLRTIEIPHSATVLSSVHSSVSAFSSKFFSLLLVGTVGAHVYLMDASYRSESVQGFSKWKQVNFLEHDKDAFANADLEVHGLHDLDHESHKGGRFEFESRVLPEKSVRVTSLEFIEQIQAIAVGYNFNAFQLFSSSNLQKFSSISVDSDATATKRKPSVTHFVYQQLADDSEYGCIWVGSGTSTHLSNNQQPGILSLYQLKFSTSTTSSDEKQVTHMQSIIKKYTRRLHEKFNSRIIRCFSIQDNSDEEFDQEFSLSSAGFRRAVFVWEDLNSSATFSHSQDLKMDLYDLEDNRFDFPSEATSGFVSCAVSSLGVDTIVDTWIDRSSFRSHNEHHANGTHHATSHSPLSLSRGNSYSGSGSFLGVGSLNNLSFNGSFFDHSSSTSLLSFDVKFLSPQAYFCGRLAGERSKYVYDLMELGPTALSEHLEVLIERGKTLGFFAQATNDQFFAMLLSHNMSALLCNYITKYTLINGAKQYVLLNPKSLLDFSWKYFANLKKHLDEELNLLFSSLVDKSSVLLRLNRIYVSLADLHNVLQAFISRDDSTTEGVESLAGKVEQISLTAQQLEVVVFLVQNDLVPLNSVLESQIKTLSQINGNRRTARGTLYNRNNWIIEEMQGSKRTSAAGSVLFVDLLCGSLSPENSNLTDGDDGMDTERLYPTNTVAYPPANIRSLVNLFATGDSSKIVRKLSILLYLLIDLQQTREVTSHAVSKAVQSFVATFSFPTTIQKVIHGFWLLDSSIGESGIQLPKLAEAVNLFTQPNVDVMFSTKIMKTLFDCEALQEALKFIRSANMTLSGLEEVTTYMRILLENKLIHEAFQFQRSFSQTNVGNDKPYLENLLFHLFHYSLTTKNLGFLFGLPLDDVEESFLVKFLKAMGSVQALDYLTLYYLQRNKLKIAVQLHENLRVYRTANSGPESVNIGPDVAMLDALIQNSKMVLPAIERNAPGIVPEVAAILKNWKASRRQGPLHENLPFQHQHEMEISGNVQEEETGDTFPGSGESKRGTPSFKSVLHARPVQSNTGNNFAFTTPLRGRQAHRQPETPASQLDSSTSQLDRSNLDRSALGDQSFTTPDISGKRKSVRLSTKKPRIEPEVASSPMRSPLVIGGTPRKSSSFRRGEPKPLALDSRTHAMQLRTKAATPKK
eukprot:TRINITY_DN6774_c0_g1_i8.p1 TRINITY_DN6774_c0_g1~~TRINITY_DN6774_c0_g1_i8.p1  ORF type:complete len:1288 (-),score=291.76 TRINITY_DN6774_c0_g1_i8:294-4157(-)